MSTPEHGQKLESGTIELWSPKKAAILSLLLTPIFGAWIISRNWKLLDEKERSNKANIWMYAGIVIYVAGATLAKYIGYTYGIAFYAIWFFASAKPQIDFLKDLHKASITKPMRNPILAAIGISLIYAGATFWLAFASALTPEKIIEQSSIAVVTDIIQNQYGGTAICKAVSIDKEIAPGFYHGTAYLDNGMSLGVAIESQGENISVTIINP